MFRDRRDAGLQLADEVSRLGLVDPVVLALPRGGVPVAVEVAAALAAPCDVFVARKVGAPANPEFGIGAIAEGGAVVATDAVDALQLSEHDFAELAEAERGELARRVQRYRGGRGLPDLAGRDVVLVDDGLATGVTAAAALTALRAHAPRRLVLAVPVGAHQTVARMRRLADEVVCVTMPRDFYAVGQWYQNFEQTTDAEVLDLLAQSRPRDGQVTGRP